VGSRLDVIAEFISEAEAEAGFSDPGCMELESNDVEMGVLMLAEPVFELTFGMIKVELPPSPPPPIVDEDKDGERVACANFKLKPDNPDKEREDGCILPLPREFVDKDCGVVVIEFAPAKESSGPPLDADFSS